MNNAHYLTFIKRLRACWILGYVRHLWSIYTNFPILKELMKSTIFLVFPWTTTDPTGLVWSLISHPREKHVKAGPLPRLSSLSFLLSPHVEQKDSPGDLD